MVLKRFKYFVILFLMQFNLNICFAEGRVENIVLVPYTNQVLVQWKDIRGAQKYEVQYSEFENFHKASLKETSLIRLEILDLKAGTSYYFKVRVLDKNVWSEWSEVKKIKTADYSVTVGTYNILSSRYDHVFPNNIWENRKEEMRNIILQSDNNPDILGIQEGMIDAQVNDLGSLLKGSYVSHISKRKISARAIFWKPEKFSLVEFDDDIEILDSNTSGHPTQRFISYVCLKEKKTGNNLMVFNIHVPASYLADRSEVRNIMVAFISEKAKELSHNKNNIPAIVLGDFNDILTTSPSKDILSAPNEVQKRGFEDTYSKAINKINANYSTHDKITNGMVSSSDYLKGIGAKRIDYIFCYPANKVQVSDYRIIINFDKDSGTVLKQPIPSDHRPVRSTLHIYN